MNTHTHTHYSYYYCVVSAAVQASFFLFFCSVAISIDFPTFSFFSLTLDSWKGKKIFWFFGVKEILSRFLHFFNKKVKKWKNQQISSSTMWPCPRVFIIIFFFLCVRFKNKHRRKEKDKTKRRARILLQQHTNTENVSHHRFISSRLRAHTLRETQHRRKRKRKRRKNKKRTPLILFVEGVETSSFESSERW